MNENPEVISWFNYKTKLKKKYPQLTISDLAWRNSTKDDIVKTIAQKLRITQKELEDCIANI
jgi:hypothetical protein